MTRSGLSTHLLCAVAALALVMSACTSTATPSPTSPPAGVTTSATAGAAQPSDQAVIRIGLLEPLTGTLAQGGKDNGDAFKLYLEGINNTIAGRRIEVVVADTEGTADGALAKAKQLVENDKVNFLAGVQSTAECYAVATYVKQAQVPLVVTGNCGAQDLSYNEKFASPYLVRMSQVLSEISDTLADYTYTRGARRASTMTADYAGGVQTIGGFQSAFIKRGGTVVQELYPKLGTTDFGPFLAQLDSSADSLAAFIPGADGLRFAQQYDNYAAKKLPIFDFFSSVTNPSFIPQLQDKVLGITSAAVYCSAYDSPENKAFQEALKKKYPDRLPQYDMGNGYSGAQFIEAALKKVNGKVEDKQAFLQALYETDVKTAKGPVKLDENHDVIQNIYIFEISRSGDRFDQKLLHTYERVSITWDRTLDEVKSFPWGETKGKLINVTKEQLPNALKG